MDFNVPLETMYNDKVGANIVDKVGAHIVAIEPGCDEYLNTWMT